jgi:hypothetical protein
MKLEPSGQKGVFLGYSETSNTYRIFIPLQWKKVVSKYVKFEEKLASRSTQESSVLIKEKEKKSLKDEQQSVVQTSGREEELSLLVLSRDPGFYYRH